MQLFVSALSDSNSNTVDKLTSQYIKNNQDNIYVNFTWIYILP